MDPLITFAARALAAGDPLAALTHIALRGDPSALALRGIAMAQLGDLVRARVLLRDAQRAFAPHDRAARARCAVATAEIALVSRDLGGLAQMLDEARTALEAHGDAVNAAHAGYLDARRLLLIGRLAEAERIIGTLDTEALPYTSKAGYWLVAAGIAMRRIQAGPARTALERAYQAACGTGIPALVAEVERAIHLFAAPAAHQIGPEGQQPLTLAEVETLLASDALVIDACRRTVRAGTLLVPLSGRPVLFTLVRTLAQAWPEDVARETLLCRTFRARDPDESYRARLRVEIGRLRKALEPAAELSATTRGYRLTPRGPGPVVVLVPPVEGRHAGLLALLADGEAWSSSSLALALSVGTRSVQRALEALSQAGEVESCGRGRACRWMAPNVPGFPTDPLFPTLSTPS
ncbi:helix-turn-helix domain-containing protein [Castellaniella sp. GW247-6E4]|uniref:helix-turn-helix domain-containing protein n=1 Tax=Castellaniella sp. GW247-6E4 TaxID=3140380 RepID=UPI003315BBD6